MLNECRKLARRKGLTARFAAAGEELQADSRTCIVYDTSLFPFEQIIDHARHYASRGVQIGTYSIQSHVVITLKEVIR